MRWLTHLDEHLFFAINHASSPALDLLFRIVTWGGHGVVLALLVVPAMYRFDRRNLRKHLLAMVLSVAIGALAVQTIKSVAARDRPARHFGRSAVHMPAEQLADDNSFPSGHAEAAFGTATYVAMLYPAAAVPALGAAGLVGLSRIYLGVHFPLDVSGGALVGVLFSVLGYRLRTRLARGDTSCESR